MKNNKIIKSCLLAGCILTTPGTFADEKGKGQSSSTRSSHTESKNSTNNNSDDTRFGSRDTWRTLLEKFMRPGVSVEPRKKD